MNTVITSAELTVEITPEGAEMSSVKNKQGIEFIWQADKAIWPRHAPVLFPIVGKLKENRFTFRETQYELGQHGFARDMAFVLEEQMPDSCAFRLSSSEKTKTVYPFDFNFAISYRLAGNTLTVAYKVVNPSGQDIYFGVGAHPGFNCPVSPNETFEDYYLEFEKSGLLQTELANGLRKSGQKKLTVDGNRLFLSGSLFDNDALVFENSQINIIHLRSAVSSHSISMACENWPYFGIWSKKGCREFVCLEPWYGVADKEDATGDITSKEGIIVLKPGQEFNCSFAITFA